MTRKPGFYVRQLQQLEEQLKMKQRRVEQLSLQKAMLQQVRAGVQGFWACAVALRAYLNANDL
jgi:hypothetical protein